MTRRKILLGAKEFVILVKVKDFVLFLNAEDLVLLVDAEEEEEDLLDASLVAPPCRQGGKIPH